MRTHLYLLDPVPRDGGGHARPERGGALVLNDLDGGVHGALVLELGLLVVRWWGGEMVGLVVLFGPCVYVQTHKNKNSNTAQPSVPPYPPKTTHLVQPMLLLQPDLHHIEGSDDKNLLFLGSLLWGV